MVLYEKNSMVLPTSTYEERGIQPALDDLPTHAEWVEWHRVHGSERMTQAEWKAWLKANRDGGQTSS
ncbi:hypothetical protein [Mesorhizobium sp.]|uniref:hypothetical protein n=1 Tax=Mesorhizobium sp. TaxID=1871066 RepID=UPI00122BD51A|nr:hypothetical protein [Mesorhizobium sp.]TJV19696.1 MAG: hypothetical protein E5Y07_00445 [Mesorhizobium sp.]